MSFVLLSMRDSKARKPYLCIWCGQPIDIGEVYKRERSIFDGEPQNNKWHPECYAACGDYMRENGEDEFAPYEHERPGHPSPDEREDTP